VVGYKNGLVRFIHLSNDNEGEVEKRSGTGRWRGGGGVKVLLGHLSGDIDCGTVHSSRMMTMNSRPVTEQMRGPKLSWPDRIQTEWNHSARCLVLLVLVDPRVKRCLICRRGGPLGCSFWPNSIGKWAGSYGSSQCYWGTIPRNKDERIQNTWTFLCRPNDIII